MTQKVAVELDQFKRPDQGKYVSKFCEAAIITCTWSIEVNAHGLKSKPLHVYYALNFAYFAFWHPFPHIMVDFMLPYNQLCY